MANCFSFAERDAEFILQVEGVYFQLPCSYFVPGIYVA